MTYIKCRVTTIVNAKEYIVCSDDVEHVAQVEEIEESLTKEVVKGPVIDFNDYECQMWVAVDISEKNTQPHFVRGVIMRQIDRRTFEVYLVDYGYNKELNIDNIRLIINPEYSEVEPLTFTVLLCEILPLADEAMVWEERVLDLTNEIFKRKPKTVIQCESLEGRVIYGDLFINFSGQKQYFSLKNIINKQMTIDDLQEDLRACSPLAEEGVPCELMEHSLVTWMERNKPQVHSIKVENEKMEESSDEEPRNSENCTCYNLVPFDGDCGRGLGRGQRILRYLQQMRSCACHHRDFGALNKISEMPFGSSANRFNEDLPALPATNSEPPDRLQAFAKKLEENKKVWETSSNTQEQNSFALCRNSSIKWTMDENGGGGGQVDSRVLSSEFVYEAFQDFMSADSWSGSEYILKRRQPSALCLRKVQRFGFTTISSKRAGEPFVFFSDAIVAPVDNFGSLPIQASIIKNLEKGGNFDSLSTIQRWAIPIIRKQCDVVIIGSSQTGKTLAYVVCMMDYIQDDCYFEDLPSGNGPHVVIISSSSASCQAIYNLCYFLLGVKSENERAKSRIKICLALGGFLEKKCWSQLTNGIHILITTPHCLVRLLETPLLLNFERLTCMILDEVDVLCKNPFRLCIRTILSKANGVLKNRPYQKIFVGRQWSLELEILVKDYLKFYAVIIGSYLEAAVRQKIRPHVFLFQKVDKMANVCDIVSKEHESSCVLIACENWREGVTFGQHLSSFKIENIVLHGQLSADKVKEELKRWDETKPKTVLIATDEIIMEWDITGVETLIHLDLPAFSKTNFFFRYSVFEQFIHSQTTVKEGEQRPQLQDFVILDDENHIQLPHVLEFLERLGYDTPEKVKYWSERIKFSIEVNKKEAALCSEMLAFGECRQRLVCKRRHMLNTDIDMTNMLPQDGWAKFMILKVHDVAHYSVLLTHYSDRSGREWSFVNGTLEIQAKMATYFSVEANRKICGTASRGSYCAVKLEVSGEDVFFRGQITEIISRNRTKQPVVVMVRLLDRGDYLKLKTFELFELPPSFQGFPSMAIEVRLVGVQPYDFDIDWSDRAVDYVARLLEKELDENQFWNGNIKLSINETIFMDNVSLKRFLPNTGALVTELSLKEILSKETIAVVNPKHLEDLEELCRSSNILSLNSSDHFLREFWTNVPVKWADFDAEFVGVKFLAAENFGRVYVQTESTGKILEDLERDCEKMYEKYSEKLSELLRRGYPAPKFFTGMHCLAKYENSWNRCRIEKVMDNQYDVFFVDHGDFMLVPDTDVICLPKHLVEFLPFQAIECSLIGLKIKENISEENLQKLYDLTQDGTEKLNVMIIRRSSQAQVTGGRKFFVNLVTQDGISLNKILVEEYGLEKDEADENHIQDVVLEVDVEESSPESVEDRGDESMTDVVGRIDEILNSEVDSEEAEAFLREFASHFPLDSTTENPSLRDEVPLLTNGPDLKEKEKIGIIEKPTFEEVTNAKEIPTISKKVLKLKNMDGVLTPKVRWRQNPEKVDIKVLVECVEDYTLDSTAWNVHFRCFVEEKIYAVNLRLFGAIYPSLTTVTVKAFHVDLTLIKIAPPPWPRLTSDARKQWWIAYDVADIKEGEDPVSKQVQTALLNMEAGVLKEPQRSDKIYSYSDAEDTDEQTDSESDDDI